MHSRLCYTEHSVHSLFVSAAFSILFEWCFILYTWINILPLTDNQHYVIRLCILCIWASMAMYDNWLLLLLLEQKLKSFTRLTIKLNYSNTDWVVGSWRGYLSGTRCRFAYAQPQLMPLSHCHSLSLALVNPDWFYFLGFTFLVPAHLGSPGHSPGAVKWW